MSIDTEFSRPSTGFGAASNTSGGASVDPGQAVTVKPANDVSPTYPGTAVVDDGVVSVTLPATVAMVAANATVGLATSQGSNAGNGTAFVNVGALTNVRLPAGNALVGDGMTIPLSKEDNTGLLATVAAHVANDLLENIALPHNYAVIQDEQDAIMVEQFDNSGSFAAIGRVTANAGSVQLANATTRIVVDQQSVSVKNGTTTSSGLIGVDQGALTGITLTASVALITNGQELTVPVTGTYATKATVSVNAAGAVTGIVLG